MRVYINQVHKLLFGMDKVHTTQIVIIYVYPILKQTRFASAVKVNSHNHKDLQMQKQQKQH